MNFCEDETDFEIMQKEIERLKGEMATLFSKIPSISRDHPSEEVGFLLLKSFLKDEPFDRQLFSLLPVKKGFLQAAFQTRDQEVIYESMVQIKQTLNESTFESLIDTDPRYRQMWERFSRSKPPLVSITDEESRNASFLREQLPSTSGLLKVVLEDSITRLEKKKRDDEFCGLETADSKWIKLMSSTRDPAKLPPVQSLICSKMGHTVNVSGIPPIQGALYSHSRRLPSRIVRDFSKFVDKSDFQQLSEHGIIV